MPAPERDRLLSRSEEPTAASSAAESAPLLPTAQPDAPRRNSSNTRFHVTPSTSNITTLDENGGETGGLNAAAYANARKGSAPAGGGMLEGAPPARQPHGGSSPAIPELGSPDSQRAVQFNVGEEDESRENTSAADNTITANFKSWRHMQTIDHPPLMDFYRNSTDAEGGAAQRPSMLELLHGGKQTDFDEFREQNVELVDQQIENENKLSGRQAKGSRLESLISAVLPDGKESSASAPAASNGPSPVKIAINPPATPRKKFGWIEGVFFRCVLNIFGVILYLRVSWVTGQAGILMGNLIVLLASLVTTITALSTCAICTNGDVKGGGAYFLISRSLGPNFGGSIGLIFSVANAVGASMYVVGFAETVRDLLVEKGIVLIDGGLNDVRVIGVLTCIVLFCIVLIGTGFESKMQVGLLVILLLSIVDYFVGTFFPPSDEMRRRGLTGYSMNTFKENLMPEFRDGNFFEIFSIYFPAATGIMAGANISGDLANAQKAIPKGTLIAILFTTLVYLLLVTVTGSTCLRDADGLHLPTLLTEVWNTTVDASPPSVPSTPFAAYWQPHCVNNGTCPYGLMNYFQVIEITSLWGPLILTGIFAASLSSALASMVSAPKIFQAVAKDKLFPGISYFAKEYGRDGDPRRAYFLAFVVALLITLVGDLNAIAPIISNFFLGSYALVNFACFDNDFAQSPGWRPSFRFYNQWVSLLGAILCVFVMFVVSWFTALLSMACFMALFFYLSHRKPDVNWGSSIQSHNYRQALHSVMRLEHTDEHVKNYRPQILVLTGNPAARPSLVDFCANICKDNSLLTCGYVVPYSPSDQVFAMISKMNEQLRAWLKKRHIKAFHVSIANPSLRAGVQSLIQSSGLGRLRPNVLALGFKQDWTTSDRQSVLEYFGIIQDAFDRNLGVIILRTNSGGLDYSEMMKAHNVGDTRKLNLKLPELRHNQSEHSLTGAAAAAAAAPSAKAMEVTPSGVMNLLPKDSARSNGELKDNGSLAAVSAASSESRCLDSNRGSLPGSHTDRPDLDEEDQTETEEHVSDNEEVVEEDEELTGAAGRRQAARQLLLRGGRRCGGRHPAGEAETRRSQKLPPDDRRPTRTPLVDQPLPTANQEVRIIDVWWLYDDGGLTLLIPYLLSQPRSYLQDAKLRVFTISTSSSGLEAEHRNMAALLSKFRISFSDITIVSDIGRKPKKETIDKFHHLIEPFRGDEDGQISDADLNSQRDRTYRQLRVSELLRQHSTEADLIVSGITKAPLYLAWLDFMTRDDLPPVLMVRGNQTSVLTFYS
ncbi:Amino acid permease-associated region domain containing protein [Aphelenchoides fujianensis]|nr:Amino acid permease-associated region domain containing protein [Aphelenchoides fujianensis]